MNKNFKSLLIALLTVSATAAAHTNKTHMQLRNQALTNLPLEQTIIKERTVAKLEDRFGGTVSATGFYGQTTKAKETGKYFGFNNKNEIKIGAAATDDLAGDKVIVAGAAATVKLEPEAVNYGVTFGYNQNLSKIVNGLNLKVTVPVERSESDAKMTVAGTDKDNVIKYFKGEYTTGQAALSNAKINGKQSTTGVANIDAQIGYKFLDKEAYNAGLNVGVVIPTGKDVKGVYAFEPQVGSNHWGLGAGLEAQARVWGNENHNVKLNFATNYRYMFEATEKRTLGLKGINWAQYHRTAVGVTETPVANVLTPDVNVTPGSQLDTILGLAYNNGGLTADLGYNMYFAEQESVKLKGAIADKVVSVLATTHAVDATVAETPAQFTHSIYGGLGYSFKEWEYPVTFGLGGKYEFASKNSAMEGWQGWAKAGLSF